MYDIYKLTPLIKFDDAFAALTGEVREQRSRMQICPSAKDGVDVSAVILEFCDKAFYKADYQAVTSYFLSDSVSYDDVTEQMRAIAVGKLFAKQ